jgi:DNA processing protein
MTSGPLSEDLRRDWLRLARTENVGPVAFRYLIETHGKPATAIAALPRMAERAGRAVPPRIPSIAEAEREMAAGQALGARLICGCEAAFPPLLAALDPPPPLIWTLGDAGLLHGRAVAIVGARIASAAGQRFARTLAHDLGEAGYLIVSGLARGIDAAAHEGSLATGTVAVLGGGPGDIYPPEHADLYRRIIDKGCIVSESPPGYRAQARDFPRRNRLISGLSLGVVVVEAELRSGSLITARLAGEQGREVFAVPGSPMDARAKGTNDLIRQGAALCEGAEDVIRALEGVGAGMREPGPPAYVPPRGDEPDIKLLRRIEDLLSPVPVAWDELARAAAAPGPQVYAALVELSLAGRCELLPGAMAVSV